SDGRLTSNSGGLAAPPSRVGGPHIPAAGALKMHQPALAAQQILPVGVAIAAALAFRAERTVVATRARQPCAPARICVRINRQHGSPPDQGAHRRSPTRRRRVAVRRRDPSTTCRLPALLR